MPDATSHPPTMPTEGFGDFAARASHEHEAQSGAVRRAIDATRQPADVGQNSNVPHVQLPPSVRSLNAEQDPNTSPALAGFDAVRQGATVDELAKLHVRRAQELAGSDAGAVEPLVHLVTAAAHLAARHPAAFFGAAADVNQIARSLLADIRRVVEESSTTTPPGHGPRPA